MARETTENIQNAKQFVNVDKLSMDVGEKARLFLPEGDSMIVEHSHELRNRARPTKAEKEAGATEQREDFYGNFLCNGRPEILNAGDLDIDQCKFCAEVQNSQGKVGYPKRAFASNLIRYATQKFDWNPIQPVQVKLVGWVHRSEKKFRTIKELKEAWGDLTNFDLLATCENPFQDLSIQVAPQSLRQDPNIAQLIQATYDNNKYTDEALTESIGRKVDNETAERHIRTVMAAGQAPAAPVGVPALPAAFPDAAAYAAGVPLTGVQAPPVQPGIPAPAAAAPQQVAPPLDLSALSTPQPVAPPAPPVAAPVAPAAPQYAAPPALPGAVPGAVPVPVAAPVPQAVPAVAPAPQPVPVAAPVPQAVPAAVAAPEAPPAIAQAPALPPLAGLDAQG